MGKEHLLPKKSFFKKEARPTKRGRQLSQRRELQERPQKVEGGLVRGYYPHWGGKKKEFPKKEKHKTLSGILPGGKTKLSSVKRLSIKKRDTYKFNRVGPSGLRERDLIGLPYEETTFKKKGTQRRPRHEKGNGSPRGGRTPSLRRLPQGKISSPLAQSPQKKTNYY